MRKSSAYGVFDFGLSLLPIGINDNQAVEVYRVDNNANQIFSAAQITDGTLAAFCNGTSGVTSIVFDRYGNNNAIQTDPLLRPILFENGSLVTENGQPSLKMDGGHLVLTNNLSVGNLLLVMQTGSNDFFISSNASSQDYRQRVSNQELDIAGSRFDFSPSGLDNAGSKINLFQIDAFNNIAKFNNLNPASTISISNLFIDQIGIRQDGANFTMKKFSSMFNVNSDTDLSEVISDLNSKYTLF